MECSFNIAGDAKSFKNKEGVAGRIPKRRVFVFSMQRGRTFITHVHLNVTAIVRTISQRIAIAGGGYADNGRGVSAYHGHPDISIRAWENGIMGVV